MKSSSSAPSSGASARSSSWATIGASIVSADRRSGRSKIVYIRNSVVAPSAVATRWDTVRMLSLPTSGTTTSGLEPLEQRLDREEVAHGPLHAPRLVGLVAAGKVGAVDLVQARDRIAVDDPRLLLAPGAQRLDLGHQVGQAVGLVAVPSQHLRRPPRIGEVGDVVALTPQVAADPPVEVGLDVLEGGEQEPHWADSISYISGTRGGAPVGKARGRSTPISDHVRCHVRTISASQFKARASRARRGPRGRRLVVQAAAVARLCQQGAAARQRHLNVSDEE